MPVTRRQLLHGAPFLSLAARGAQTRPNVVMFMTDDHGAWATGAYGCGEIHTPNIDRLAATGARFDRAFACTPVCSPSRATFITGCIPSTHGVQDWLRPVDSFGDRTRRWLEGLTTYSEVLAGHGYTLGMSGKWHMGEDDKPQAGFSWWFTVPGGGGTYRDPEFVKNGVKQKLTGYKTDLVTDGALEFLDRQKGSSRPFYLLVPYYAPHTPFNYQPEQYRAPYAGAKFSCFPRTEVHPWQNPGLRAHHNNQDSMRAYSALITGVDHNVGRILKRLEEMGVRGNTLVVFTADQGWNAGHHGVWGKGNGTWPFNMYEEAIRVPMIWNHPGKIRPAVLNPLVSSYDYFPTILDYLGIPAPAGGRRVGRSYAAWLRGAKPKWSNRLYFEYSMVRAVRTENLKYVERTKEWPSELYDLEDDPGETRNLIEDARHRKQLEALRADLAAFFRRSGAPPIEQWQTTTKQELTKYSR